MRGYRLESKRHSVNKKRRQFDCCAQVGRQANFYQNTNRNCKVQCEQSSESKVELTDFEKRIKETPYYIGERIKLEHVEEEGEQKQATEPANQNYDADTQHIKQLDGMIDYLLACDSQQEMLDQLGSSVHMVDKRFWLRIAARTDIETDPDKDKQLRDLSKYCLEVLSKSADRSTKQIGDTSRVLQEIMEVAADEEGNWNVPLNDAEIGRMKAKMESRKPFLNEAFLSNAYGVINKAKRENVQGLAEIVQKALQIYAAMEATIEDAEQLQDLIFNELVTVDPKQWEVLIRKRVKSGDITEQSWEKAVKQRIEWCALQLEKGSYKQRVLSSYLSELKLMSSRLFQEMAEEELHDDDDDEDELADNGEFEALAEGGGLAVGDGVNSDKEFDPEEEKRKQLVAERLREVMNMKSKSSMYLKDDFEDESDLSDITAEMEVAKQKQQADAKAKQEMDDKIMNDPDMELQRKLKTLMGVKENK